MLYCATLSIENAFRLHNLGDIPLSLMELDVTLSILEGVEGIKAEKLRRIVTLVYSMPNEQIIPPEVLKLIREIRESLDLAET